MQVSEIENKSKSERKTMQLKVDYLKRLTELKTAGKISQGKREVTKQHTSGMKKGVCSDSCFGNGQLYAPVVESLDQMDKFLEKYSSYWLAQEGIENWMFLKHKGKILSQKY